MLFQLISNSRRTAPIFSNSYWPVCVSRTYSAQSCRGVSLLLRIGNPAKRERALTSAYKLLVDISSMTSLPAMCRLVSAVWWMVPPAPPISLLSSRPSRRALPQIVAYIGHKCIQVQTIIHTHRVYCIRDSLRESFWRGRIIERCDNRERKWCLFSIYSLYEKYDFLGRHSTARFNGRLLRPTKEKNQPLDTVPCSRRVRRFYTASSICN